MYWNEVFIILALVGISIYSAYKFSDYISKNDDGDRVTSFVIVLAINLTLSVFGIIVGIQIMSNRKSEILKDYIRGGTKMVIKETRENRKVIEKDTIFNFNESKKK